MNLFKQLSHLRRRAKIRRETPQFWHFEGPRLGYIQIPKIATRSIRHAFGESELMRPYADFRQFERACSQHMAPAEVRRQFADYYIFAFVRHPLARLYSAYVNKIVDAEKIGERNIFENHGMRFGMPFGEFVERVADIEDGDIDRHLRSQTWFLCDEQGMVPTRVGRMEQFADEWQALRERFPLLPEIAHKNKGAGEAAYLEHYTPRTLELAQARYRQDFLTFGYEQR